MLEYNNLYQDYISGKFPLLGNPHKVDWKQKSDELVNQSEVHILVKKWLKAQNADLNSPRALNYLALLDDPTSGIIITGQQLGLMASPLYTVYKAATVLKIVEKLNNEDPAGKLIPVFWLESEDHDFQEINHFGIWDRRMNPQKVIYKGKDQLRKSIRNYSIEPAIKDVISELREKLVETEFTADLMNNLDLAYSPGSDWVSATRSFLKQIFHEYGLLFFQPGAPEIKSVSAPFFQEFLSKSEQIDSIFTSTSNKISAAGYDLQVPLVAGKTYVHIETGDQQRSHIYHDAAAFVAKEGNFQLNTDQLEEYITQNAQKISSAVISRPVLQSWLLPVVAYVAGPAEIAYWAQLRNLFNEFNLPIPVLYPRASITLVEPKINRFIHKHAIDIAALPLKKQDFIHEFYTARGADERDPFPELRDALDHHSVILEKYIKDIDATLLPASEKLFERLNSQIENLENKIIQARERKNQTVTSQLNQIYDAIFPEGIPQERFASVVYFLNKFGMNFTGVLLANMNIEKFQHQVIYLGD